MAKRTVRKNNKSCNKNIKYIKLDNLSKDEQAFVGYNPNNPRGNVDSSKSVYSISTFLVKKINNTIVILTKCLVALVFSFFKVSK